MINARPYARRFLTLALLAVAAALLALAPGTRDASADDPQWGWELGDEFTAGTVGYQGSDSGLVLECPTGSLAVGSRMFSDTAGPGIAGAKRITGIQLVCLQVNELGAGPHDNFIYNDQAPLQVLSWGYVDPNITPSTPQRQIDFNEVWKGIWAFVRKGSGDPKLKPRFFMGAWAFTFSSQAEELEFQPFDPLSFVREVRAQGSFGYGPSTAGQISPQTTNFDFASCGPGVYADFSSPPITDLKGVRGMRLFRYTSASQEKLGGIQLLCQDLNRVELPSPVDQTPGPPGGTGLTIEKRDNFDPIASGSTLTYTLEVSNLGPNTQTNVRLTDRLPASWGHIRITRVSQGSCDVSDETVSCNLGSLAAGASATVDVAVTAPLAALLQIDNTATVSSDSEGPDEGDNTTIEPTLVFSPDGSPTLDGFTVTKADDVDPVAVGGTLTYTVTVTNDTSQDVAGATLIDPLPGGVTFVSVMASEGGTCGVLGVTVMCAFGPLAAGSSAWATIVGDGAVGAGGRHQQGHGGPPLGERRSDGNHRLGVHHRGPRWSGDRVRLRQVPLHHERGQRRGWHDRRPRRLRRQHHHVRNRVHRALRARLR